MAEPTGDNLKTLALMRLEDAQLLLAGGRWSAAYYLAGYAVECALKVLLAQRFRANVIPDRALVQRTYTHNLTELMTLAELRATFDQRVVSVPGFGASWSIVTRWNESSRYDIVRETVARIMVEAVADETGGVLPWLKEHW